jgi:hypothetical protein
MKNFALIFLFAIAFTNCKSVENQQISNSNSRTETNSTKVEIAPPSEHLLKDLTKKQKNKLDESLPPKVREILDKADEIDIYYNIDKETRGFGALLYGTIPNAGARVSDVSLKKQFLESFYYDAALGEGGAMCFTPRHKITAKHNNKTVDLDICYQCGNFKGNSSNGHIGGSMQHETKSAAILSEIIEKYGTDLQ